MKGPMWRYTFELPVQLQEALGDDEWNGMRFRFPHEAKYKNIVICGMGGSGIAATIVKDYIGGVVDIPIEIVKDYNVPAYVGMDTLVICSSYSGNTEETLCCYDQAIDLQATVVCITSGGKLKEKAIDQGIHVLRLPEGRPPRTCIGYSFVKIMKVFEHLGYLVNTGWRKDIVRTALELSDEQKRLEKQGEKLARKINGKLPIFYSSTEYAGVMTRTCQQLSENAKMLAYSSVVPEMNHNELVGWHHIQHEKVAVMLVVKNMNPRVKKRMQLMKKIIRKSTANVFDIVVDTESTIYNIFSLIMVGDYASLYLAEFRKVDPERIMVIDYLKKALGKL